MTLMTFTDDGSTWSEEASDRFELALRLLNELATTLAHRVDAAEASHQDVAALRAEQLAYLEQQQRLRITDHQEIDTILREAPDRLQQLQQENRP